MLTAVNQSTLVWHPDAMGHRRTSAGKSGRRRSRPRSSHSVAVLRRVDGSTDVTATEQMALFDTPVPALVVTVKSEATVTGRADNSSSSAQLPLADLGNVLAQVLDFHEAFDLPREPVPTAQVGDVLAQLRVRLLREEVDEFADATERRDVVDIADALADIVYVAYGSAVTYGIDLDAVIREVHRANMSKLDLNGRPVMREDGKVMKSSRYTPPDIPLVLADQLALFDPNANDALTTSSAS